MSAEQPPCLDALPLPLFRDRGTELEPYNGAARDLLEESLGRGLERQVLEASWRDGGWPYEAGGDRWLLLSPSPQALRLLEQHGAMGRFAGGLTHNLNNPLNALSGMVQLMMFRMPDLPDLAKIDTQGDELANMIRRVGDRFRRLTDWPEGMPMTWEDVLREELVFFRSNMTFKHRTLLDARMDGETRCPLNYVDASWLFGRLLEAVLVHVPADGQLPLTIDMHDGWPRLSLESPKGAPRVERAFATLLDGRVASLLAAHGRRVGWNLDETRLELGCPPLASA